MKTLAMTLIFTLLAITFCYSIDDQFVLVDTVYVELAGLTGTIFHNMLDNTYVYYPNETSLSIGYGRSPWGNPGVREFRSFLTFQTRPVPREFNIHSAVLSLFCWYYLDNSEDLIWPHYYSTPYPVQVDHIQYASITPEVFNLQPLSANVAVLQDSAYIGWIGTDVTNSYIDDIQQLRTYSQYGLHFPPYYDVTGYAIDSVSYGRLDWGTPKLIITYHKQVSNSDDVLPIYVELIKQVYPLPAREVLNIDFTDKDNNDTSLLLYDLRGRLVHSESRVIKLNGKAQVPISEYPSGIYFLKVTDRHRSQMKKITIVK